MVPRSLRLSVADGADPYLVGIRGWEGSADGADQRGGSRATEGSAIASEKIDSLGRGFDRRERLRDSFADAVQSRVQLTM